jgi:small subunit ribosomal protein S14
MNPLVLKMNARIQKDIRKRQDHKELEHYRNVLKSVQLDETLPMNIRQNASLLLSSLGKKGSRTLIKNRCVLSGRSKATFSTFRMSRIMFRQMALSGNLPNVIKKSW